MMDVDHIREQIPATESMTYVNTGWQGPSPVSVVEAIKNRLEYESYNGPTSSEVQESGSVLRRQAREAVAKLVNASPDEVLLTENTTHGLNVVMNGLPWQEGDEIITCDLEHPSILIPSYHMQSRHGVVVKVLPVASDEPHERVLDKVEAAMSDRTRMVFLSHVEFSTGLCMPVEEIGQLTRARGIWLLLDGAQGPGHIRVDVRDIGCDFYSMPGQKWLLGPAGTGALYIRDGMIPLVEPASVSSRAVSSYDYDGGYEPKTDDMDKFLVSTASTALRAGFLEAIRFVERVGMEDIESRNLELAASLRGRLANLPGVEVLSPMDGPGCSGLVSFAVDGVDPKEAATALWESERIVIRSVDYPPSLRASMDFFNTEEEVEKLGQAVGRLRPV